MLRPTPRFATAVVADVMHGPAITCGPETPFSVIARLMADDQVHAVVVTGIEGTAWGVVTALDLATAAAADGFDCVARDIAATEPLALGAATPLADAARIMAEHQLNHVLVIDDGGRPAGVMSTIDIAQTLAADAPSDP